MFLIMSPPHISCNVPFAPFPKSHISYNVPLAPLSTLWGGYYGTIVVIHLEDSGLWVGWDHLLLGVTHLGQMTKFLLYCGVMAKTTFGGVFEKKIGGGLGFFFGKFLGNF